MSLGLEILEKEYKNINERWEAGPLYYRIKEYFKKFGRPLTKGRIRVNKAYITAILTLAKLGLPITSSLVSSLANQRIEVTLSTLDHYCSLNILEPQDPIMGGGHPAPFTRRFKLQPEFIKFVYRPLKETQPEVSI